MSKTTFFGSAAALLLMAAGGASCTPTRDYHGFIADTPDALNVQVGVDTQSTVRQRLGTPSTMSVLEANQTGAAAGQTTWYYVAVTQERFAFYNPRTTDRVVMAVRFDANQTVSAVDRYGLEEGRVVDYSHDRTPTRGRELGILEQIFGTIGRGSPLPQGTEERNQQNRR